MNKKLPLYLQSCHYSFKVNFRPQALALFSFLLLSLTAFAQGPGCPNVSAGVDIELEPGELCTDLTASYLETGETTSYAVSSIPYEPPFPFTGLENPVSVGKDDEWSAPIDLPFDFCFFGDIYTKVNIGSNGIISFNAHNEGEHCDWVIGSNETIPNGNLHDNAIMVFHDLDPRYGNNEIGWELLGEAPCRTLVVSFSNVPYYNFANPNNQATSTFQMVMYETTNAIDFFVQSKPDPHEFLSDPINGGRAVLGIQNKNGIEGYTPPGRNTGVWAATSEAWRFTPNGASNVVFSWLDSDGNLISHDTTINVCPTEETTVYTAQAIYTNCNGDVVTETDDVTVTKADSFTLNLGGDQELCDASSYEITAEIIDGNPADATFLWSTGETTQSITVTTSGTYSVEVTIGTNTLSASVEINFNELPLFDLGANVETCFYVPVALDASPSNYNPADAAYEWSLDGVVLAGETNPTLNATQNGVYSVIVDVAGCSNSDEVTISQKDIQVSLGDDFDTCFESPKTLTARATGYNPSLATYEWTLDGVTIVGANSSSLIIDEIGTYAVTASFGDCTASNSIEVSFKDNLIVTVDDDFQTCPKEPHTLTAKTRERNATYQWYLNETLLTGETNSTLDIMIEQGTMGTQTYSVVISVGGCTGTDSVDVSLYNLTNCVISQGISPNGDGFNDSLELSWLNDRTGIVKLKIYNRWGTLVFDQRNYSNQWRGQSHNGNDLPTGTYFYVIDLKSVDAVYGGRTTGWIYLNQKAN